MWISTNNLKSSCIMLSKYVSRMYEVMSNFGSCVVRGLATLHRRKLDLI